MDDGKTYNGDTLFSHQYATHNTYYVKLAVNNEVCRDSLFFDLYVNPMPKADFSINQAQQCNRGHEFEFTNNSTIAKGKFVSQLYLGDTKNNIPFSSYKYKYAAIGNYNVELKAISDSACRDSVTKVVTVFESPVATIYTYDSTQCFNGHSFIVKPKNKATTTAIYTTQWNITDGASYTGNDSITHQFAKFGNYLVKEIVTTSDNCADSATLQLIVYPSPKVDFDVKPVCYPEASAFNNLSNIAAGSITVYDWLLDNKIKYSTRDVNHAFAQYGIYDAKLTVTSDKGCVETIAKPAVAEVYKKPKASFIFSEVEDNRPEITWRYTSTSIDADLLEWHFSDHYFDTKPDFTRDFFDTITLRIVHIAVTNNGCKDTAIHTNFISTEQIMFIPNTFTPNGDGLNDIFRPEGVRFVRKYEMIIFDRWGEIIFQTHDINQGWDGSYKGEPQADGTFVYSINYLDITGQRKVYNGPFYLNR
jgi:gliding motility-associated-like protein